MTPSIPAAWDGDHLVITDPEAIAQIDRPYLSPSSASTVASCPARFAGEKLLPRTEDPFGAAELGTSAHHVLEFLYALPAAQRDRVEARAILNVLAKNTPHIAPTAERPSRQQDWLDAVWTRVEGIWEIEQPKKILVRQREWSLDGIEIGDGVPFKGFIDRADITGDENQAGTSIIDYKGLALDTLLPTPAGWTTMADVQVGDLLVGGDGRPATVIGKSQVHHRNCYRITFSDGSGVVCDNVHLWSVLDLTGNGDREVLGADAVYERLTQLQNAGHPNSLAIPNAPVFEFAEQNLTVDPYRLGTSLGSTPGEGIPQEYLRSSKAQRIALLRGLMDTAGSWRNNRATFTHTDRRLVDQFIELVISLGITTSPTEAWWRKDGNGRFHVSFLPLDFCPFITTGKSEQYKVWRSTVGAHGNGPRHRSGRRLIKHMEPVESVPTQCVEVDSPNSLYLCGPHMIPCHNSGKVKYPAPWGDPHGDQLRLYSAAVTVMDGRPPINARVFYTAHGKDRFISLKKAEMDDTLKRFVASWITLRKTVKEESFPTKLSALCAWCSLASTCPTALAAGVVPAPVNTARLEIPTIRPMMPVGSTAPAGLIVDTTTNRRSGKPGTQGGNIMLVEDRPYYETAEDGVLNPTSYAATAVFGTVELAVAELHKAGVEIKKVPVKALSETFATVVFAVQESITGKESWQDGANTRARGALRTTLETLPLPFGGTSNDWAEWVSRATIRGKAICAVAVGLWEHGPGEEPWIALSVDPDEFVDG